LIRSSACSGISVLDIKGIWLIVCSLPDGCYRPVRPVGSVNYRPVRL
jgi:hypothetical protein